MTSSFGRQVGASVPRFQDRDLNLQPGFEGALAESRRLLLSVKGCRRCDEFAGLSFPGCSVVISISSSASPGKLRLQAYWASLRIRSPKLRNIRLISGSSPCSFKIGTNSYQGVQNKLSRLAHGSLWLMTSLSSQ